MALVLAAAALTLCLAAVVNIRVPLSHGPGWWQFVRVAGFLAFWLACLGALLGVFVLLQAMHRGASRWLGLLAVGLGLAALAVAGWGVWQVHTPAYWLQDPREPSTAQLDTLGPEGVVRTYLTSQDLSVQYRLSDAAGRASMTDPNVVQDLSLLAGVDHLRVTPATGASGDADHRSFAVTYTSRAPDAAGAEPGQQAMTVDLTRQHGGPWRVSYWGFPL